MISPLLANIYFRRFLRAWEQNGLERKLKSRVVNYADDFVILTRGRAEEAKKVATQILSAIKLTVNATKTRVCKAWEQSFDFLGYTFGKRHVFGGRSRLAVAPSAKSVKKYREKVRELTGSSQTEKKAEEMLKELNSVTRGFWNYFSLGPTGNLRGTLDRYVWKRLALRVKRKDGKRGFVKRVCQLEKQWVCGAPIPRRWECARPLQAL